MLQISALLAILLAPGGLDAEALTGDSIAVQWVLEDALEEDLLILDIEDMAGPDKLAEARDAYANGEYRRAAEKFEQVAALHLPDGNADYINFALGECYRNLELERIAIQRYTRVINQFPESPNAPPARFRLLEYAYARRDNAAADSLLAAFQTRLQAHPLYSSALYVIGKLYYRTERYGEAIEMMRGIGKQSSRYAQARFLSGLCSVRLKDDKKAFAFLNEARTAAADRRLAGEAAIVSGDLYLMKGETRTALRHYDAVEREAPRYHHALVKSARVYAELQEFDKARTVAERFIDQYPRSEYFFEMAAVLERVYEQTGDKAGAARISNMVYRQIIDARMAFEVSNELTAAYDLIRRTKNVRFNARSRGRRELAESCDADLARLRSLVRACRAVLVDIGAMDRRDEQVEGLAERRYLASLRRSMQAVEDTLLDRKFLLEDLLREPSKRGDPSGEVVSLRAQVDSLRDMLALLRTEYDDLRNTTADIGRIGERFNNEVQAKFIDWAFMRYLEKKRDLVAMNAEIARRKKDVSSRQDSLAASGGAVAGMFASLDRDRLAESITRDRNQLIDHIRTLLEGSSRTRHHAPILFRLAELYYDRATETFDTQLRAYERAMAQGADSSALHFPEYDLGAVMRIYERMIDEFPNDWLADDAHFYKAMAQRKSGNEEAAVATLATLVAQYPESEFFVEANMNIGRYYFEHPKARNNTGYERAEEAFRKVLYYRDHPQFVEALYHLGWCYYMQDHFDEAIAVFKYLVEAVELDFDPARADEKLTVNPLLREEAIDYIAISFDEERDVEGAISFLSLVGNDDYAALVLKRIGELREEDLDYSGAVGVYKRLLRQYPHSLISPDAAVALMKLYAMQNRVEEGMAAREEFFRRYAEGGQWQSRAAEIDSGKVANVDSMAISIGLYVADELYRAAERHSNDTLYQRAAENYRKVVAAYPDHARAAEARWNMAVILDTKLNKPKNAYAEFIAFSRIERADSARRKQAALNAIAIAQRLADAAGDQADSVIGPAAEKMIEAADNFAALFPDSKEFADVALSIGSLYFNRGMHEKAADAYQQITVRGEDYPSFFKARFMIGKCLFSQEKWIPAAAAFGDVWRRSPDWTQRDEAYTLLLQAKFLFAKQLFAGGEFEKAAIAYEAMEKEYPGSEYGDIALFNAAESSEKLEDWQRATSNYRELYKKYPSSKLAPDALFNAASAYEKAKKFDKAADVYEIIAERYPESDKAKDALFNVGFCYEKLGKLEKMAEANERYSARYPGEKDVEAMLLRSARFYLNAGMHDRARNAFRNFVRRFPSSPLAVEALYMTGKSFLDVNDRRNAALAFAQAEQHNERLAGDGGEANNFYAAEAAVARADLTREEFMDIGLDVKKEEMKSAQKRKTELLAEAVKGYQRAIQYRSERMFEAAFRIGELYEAFAVQWSEQARYADDPVKAALAEKDIALVSAKLMRKSFEPYAKVVELTGRIDSLSAAQRQWRDSAAVRLGRAYLAAGESMVRAYTAMYEAPAPKEIQSKPLFHMQYVKQLLETIEPMKLGARDYYYQASLDLDAYGFATLQSEKCRDRFARLTFGIPNGYDRLAERILRNTDKLPADLSVDEREELIFQFEDMVFELQDRALFGYEDAMTLLRERGATQSRWYGKIIERLAVLDPETYGKKFYQAVRAATGDGWYARGDSVAKWNGVAAPAQGWTRAASPAGARPIPLGEGTAKLVWGPDSLQRIFLWKPLFCGGAPRAASVHLLANGPYELYVNETLVLTDTSRAAGTRIDSISDLTSLLRGGDNSIAVMAAARDSARKGVAIVVHALLDTTQHFVSTIEAPAVAARPDSAAGRAAAADSAARVANPARAAGDSADAARDRDDVLAAISAYEQRTRETGHKIKRERLALQKLAIREQDVDERLAEVKKAIAALKQRRAADEAPRPAEPAPVDTPHGDLEQPSAPDSAVTAP